MNSETSAPPQQPDPLIATRDLAAGLLAHDGPWVTRWYLALAAVAVLHAQLDQRWIGWITLIEQCLGLVVLGSVAERWVRLFSPEGAAQRKSAVGRFIGISLVLWLLVLPMQLALLFPQTMLWLLPVGIPGLFIWLRCFFYAVPALASPSPLRGAVQESLQVTTLRPLIAVSLIFAPYAWQWLLGEIASVPAPDERSVAVATVVALIGPLASLLIVYLSVAASFVLLGDHEWHRYGFAPYRASRFTTLAVNGVIGLPTLMTPRSALAVTLMALCVWGGNQIRASTTKPPIEILSTQVMIAGTTVSVDLTIRDPEWRFRGLRPVYFSLAGERGTPVTTLAGQATIRGDAQQNDVRLGLPRVTEPINLRLRFNTVPSQFGPAPSGNEVRQLNDIYLWYRYARLQRLDLSAATITDPQPAPATPSVSPDPAPSQP